MTKDSIEAWKISQGVTGEVIDTLIKSKTDKTLQKVSRVCINEMCRAIQTMNEIASRNLIIEVLGTFVERLKIEEEIEQKFGPPPSSKDIIEDPLEMEHPPVEGDDPPDGTPGPHLM